MFWTIFSLFIAAMAMFALEILTPSFGAIMAIGASFLVAAVWVTFTSFGTVAGFVVLFASIVFVPVYFMLLVKFLPKSPLGKRLFLGKAPDATGDGTPHADRLEAMIGKRGKAETLLRPSGAVRIDGSRIGARAESGLIEKGTAIRVVRTEGAEVIVQKISG